MIIVFAVIGKHLLERSLPAHGVDEGYFHAGQSNVRRKNIHAFLMVKNTFPGRKWHIIEYLAHEIAQCHWQGIRLRMSQADGRTTLGITISNEHLLSFTGKVNAEIHAGSGLTRASLLID